MALSTKLIRGSTVNLAEHALKIGLMFVITPLMIRYLGENDYGTWLLALAVIAWLRRIDLGVSLSGTRFLGRAIGAGNAADYESTLGTLTWLFNRMGLLVMVLTAAICLALPIWIADPELLRKVRWLIFGFGFSTALQFWTRIFEVVLKSHVRYDLIGIASIVKSVLQGGLVIVFLLSGHGIFTLLILFIATETVDQVLRIVYARRISGKIAIPFWGRNAGAWRPLLRYSASAMASNTGNGLRGGIDPLIVAHASSVGTVPIYSVGARFLSVFADIVNAIFGGNFVAAFSQLHGRNDPALLIRSFLTSIRFSAAIATLGGVALIVYGPAFIERWVGNAFADSATVLLILTPPTVLSMMQYPIWGLFYSQDKQRWLAALMLGGGLFNLGLSLWLASRIGYLGVVWATLIEMSIVFGLFVPALVVRVCGIGLLDYLRPMASAFLWIGASSGFYFLAIRPFVTPDYLHLALLGAGHFVMVLPVFWFFIFSREERTRLREAVPFLKSR